MLKRRLFLQIYATIIAALVTVVVLSGPRSGKSKVSSAQT